MSHAANVLTRAAGIVSRGYSPRYAAALQDGSQTAVIDRRASIFSATGAIERAASLDTGDLTLVRGDRLILATAKAAACLHIGAIHLDHWEAMESPAAFEVHDAFRDAGIAIRGQRQ